MVKQNSNKSNKKCKPNEKEASKLPCSNLVDEKFFLQAEDDSDYDFWKIFCFPYKICSKICDSCLGLCTGANQCVLFLMVLQWCVCKITRCTNPDPIIFPYYFYMFCQIILLTIFFWLLWLALGKTVVLPFFTTIYEVFMGEDKPPPPPPENMTRMSFRKYCFRKSELFNTPPETSSGFQFRPIMVITFVIESFINGIL